VKAGHKMITGAFVKAPVTQTTTFTADFAGIGRVSATITP
jgi:2-keto-4-pentenoate hydratase